MNNMKKYLMMFAALVATTVGFTACSSEEELANAEQGQEQERGVVKTEFSISFPQKIGGTTRMSASTIQDAGQTFRGIRDIELYPFKIDSSAVINAAACTDGLELSTPIILNGGTTAKSGPSSTKDYAISGGETALYANTNSHLYQNVDIPIGTKSFIFYGLADYTETSNVPAEYGSLIKTAATKLENVTFSPEVRYKIGTVDASGDSIAAYLTSIAKSKFTGTTGDSLWSETPNVALRALYENLKSMKAGSFNNMKAAVQKLYKELKKENSSDASITKKMKQAIMKSITATEYGVTADSDGNLTFTKMKSNSYPRNIGLPDGAAYINWQLKSNSTTEYEFKALFNNGNTGLNTAPLNSYVYPAALYYYVLSNIKTSKVSKASFYEDYATPSSGKTWKDITDQYTNEIGYDNTEVGRETRSIAILHPVQYAVGRLDVTVHAQSATLLDSKSGHSITLGGTSFPVTGILVHGQKPVDYKFQQKPDESNIYTVYDTVYYQNNSAKNIYLTNGTSNRIHTLVLETKEAGATTGQTDVVAKIAVEFLNNTTDTIYGYNGQLIYPQCRFYLIGTLDPALNDGQEITGHTNTKDANGNLIKKAFMQDYTTTANLKIASLRNAYNTLPDLALPQLEMGLSIDLSWKTGISQDINIE